jgi:hypothetical protein
VCLELVILVLTISLFSLLGLWLNVVVQIGYNIFLFVNISGESNLSPRFTPFLFRCFLHVFVLFVLIVTNRYKTYFHRRARRHGYLQFYQQTRTAVKLPFIVWALGRSKILCCSIKFFSFKNSETTQRLI